MIPAFIKENSILTLFDIENYKLKKKNFFKFLNSLFIFYIKNYINIYIYLYIIF